jgi:putative heme-binding domain-containing protein
LLASGRSTKLPAIDPGRFFEPGSFFESAAIMCRSAIALLGCPLLLGAVLAAIDRIAVGEEPAAVKNAHTSEKDIRQGHLFVNGYCSRCHGKDAAGAKGPNLTSGRFRHGGSDEAIFHNIRNGIRSTGMPGFPGDDTSIWRMISFLRWKQNENQPEPPVGDAVNGKQLFVHHKCDTCHWTRNSGGRLGPDLSQWRGSGEFFRRAMTHPDEEIDPQYQRVVVRFSDGQILAGMRLYEDTYFLLLIDDQQNLHTISHQEIDQLAMPKQSLMASYAKELDEPALQDLAAYVYSLSEKTTP